MSIIITFLLGSLLLTEPRDSVIRVGACTTPGYTDGVFVQGQYAYIADRAGFTSIDISIPENPIVSDFNSLENPTGVFILDTIAFLNGALSGPAFAVFDVSDPTNLTKISVIGVPGYGGDEPKGIYVRGSLAYFADSDGGFLIIDITDLSNPTVLCTLETPGRVIDLFVRDTLAYLADMNRLLIVNVKIPYNPAIIGSLSIGDVVGGVYDVFVSGDYAFVTELDVWNGYGKVNMVNVSDPTVPFVVNQVSMPGTPYGLFVVDDKIYVAADDWWAPPRMAGKGRADIEGGIRIVQWEPPGIMNLLDNTDTPGRCRDISVIDSFIYVTVVDSFMIYKYRSTGVVENDEEVVLSTSLVVSPNPFYDKVKISFTIPSKLSVSLEIYDTQGRKIKDLAGGCFIPGHYDVVWGGKDNNELEVAAGVYYIILSTKSGVTGSTQQEKIIFVR
jgi:hypothetical protein